MKKLLSLTSLLAVGLVFLAASSSNAANLAVDNSSFYNTASWTDGSNFGSGFGAWAFDGGDGTGGGHGTFIGGTGLDPVSSFGIFSFPADSGASQGVLRPFTGGPLLAGQTFSISLGYNAIAANGLVGLDLQDSGGNAVFSLQGDGTGDWLISDGGSLFGSGAAEAANTPFVFTLTYNGGQSYSYTLGTGSGVDFMATSNIGDISSVRLYSYQQGADNNFGFDNLAIVPEPSTWAMMIGGLGMLTLLRRRRS